jgi:hypothetical protein
METESSLRNIVFGKEDRAVDNVIVILINHHHISRERGA